ncbi:MAG: 2-amino-4-hydroxy-6-hydroxymethyldihydropteridine diphosphokinase [Alcanivoracaceae bacterium]|nr:2-amino-4-hydroxy-6-hydroxymethyldihydropteridine diphosphokinase [Alcanivoracaceae bacterium]
MTTDAAAFNVFIGLGSNLGDSATTLQRAAQSLAELPGTQLIDVSPLFRTRPVGPQDQPDYLNAAAHLVTNIAPAELLDALKEIEQQLGRTPTRHWGERVIDLDILDYENVILDSERLTLPHAHIGERGFVLVPLHAIAPQWQLADGRQVENLYRTCNKDGILYHGEIDWRAAP